MFRVGPKSFVIEKRLYWLSMWHFNWVNQHMSNKKTSVLVPAVSLVSLSFLSKSSSYTLVLREKPDKYTVIQVILHIYLKKKLWNFTILSYFLVSYRSRNLTHILSILGQLYKHMTSNIMYTSVISWNAFAFIRKYIQNVNTQVNERHFVWR